MDVTADDIYLLRNIERYGDFHVVREIDSSVTKLIRMGLVRRVMLPHRDYDLEPAGYAALRTRTTTPGEG
jgi:hypothetical protein